MLADDVLDYWTTQIIEYLDRNGELLEIFILVELDTASYGSAEVISEIKQFPIAKKTYEGAYHKYSHIPQVEKATDYLLQQLMTQNTSDMSAIARDRLTVLKELIDCYAEYDEERYESMHKSLYEMTNSITSRLADSVKKAESGEQWALVCIEEELESIVDLLQDMTRRVFPKVVIEDTGKSIVSSLRKVSELLSINEHPVFKGKYINIEPDIRIDLLYYQETIPEFL